MSAALTHAAWKWQLASTSAMIAIGAIATGKIVKGRKRGSGVRAGLIHIRRLRRIFITLVFGWPVFGVLVFEAGASPAFIMIWAVAAVVMGQVLGGADARDARASSSRACSSSSPRSRCSGGAVVSAGSTSGQLRRRAEP